MKPSRLVRDFASPILEKLKAAAPCSEDVVMYGDALVVHLKSLQLRLQYLEERRTKTVYRRDRQSISLRIAHLKADVTWLTNMSVGYGVKP